MQISAIVTESPNAYLPAVFFNMISSARENINNYSLCIDNGTICCSNLPSINKQLRLLLNPSLIQCCAHSCDLSLPIYFNTTIFCIGWMPAIICNASERTAARSNTSVGSNDGVDGYCSSRNCIIANDSVTVWSPTLREGTKPAGLSNRYASYL